VIYYIVVILLFFFFQRLHPQLIKKIKLKRLNNKKQLETDTQQNIVTTLPTFQKKSTVAAKQVNIV